MKQKVYLILALIAFFIVWWSRSHFFFWDTVQLTSMHAHWFYERGFGEFFLPEAYDSGHPPFWGMYHALLWKMFGKSLIVSHLGMFPFVYGSMVFTYLVGRHLTGSDVWGLASTGILLADPVFLTQATLVSPDVALICFFVMVLYGYLAEKKWLMVIGAVGLSMVSLRGMMTLAGLGVFIVWDKGWSRGLRQMLYFLPGVIVGIGFLVVHYLHVHWVGFHSDSPWNESFTLVNVKGLVKNVLVFIWRMMDVGRVFIWLMLGVFWIKYRAVVTHRLWRLFISLGLFLVPPFLVFKGLNGMRYLLPMMVTVDLIFIEAVFRLKEAGYPRRMMVLWVALVVFVTGHTWRYPDSISMSWDTTLLHVPYYDLRQKMLEFMAANEIPVDRTATAFPNTAPLEYIDLTGDPRRMLPMESPDADYYFVSNIYNDLKRELPQIDRQKKLIKAYQKGGIFVKLYEK